MTGASSTLSFAFFVISALASAVAPQTFLETFAVVPDAVRIGDGDSLHCESWKFSVETNDAGIWQTVPSRCVGFVKDYMDGPRYASDCDAVAEDSVEFAQTVGVLHGAGVGKGAWIFDVDETLLSNLPYYAVNGYGSGLFNETSFNEWVDLAVAPAILSSLMLYDKLQRLGFHLVLLTGRSEDQRNATEKNLLFAGYRNWEMLILRAPSDLGKSAVLYKSERRAWLASEGYRIYGSSGDQWSDLKGSPTAIRSFKLPNPMYYIE